MYNSTDTSKVAPLYAKTEFIYKELKDRNKINACQQGFMQSRSCQTNLISFVGKYIKFLSIQAYTITVL